MLVNKGAFAPPSPRFQGSVKLLTPFIMNGMQNKAFLAEDSFFVPRPDIDEQGLLQRLTDPAQAQPVLLEGAERSGKSVLANRLVRLLREQGKPVFQIDNCMKNVVAPENYLNQAAFDALKEQIQNVEPSADRIFLFVDEPQVIPVLDAQHRPEILYQPQKSVLFQLAALVAENPRVKLVGVSSPKAFPWVEAKSNRQQRQLLETLFAPEHYLHVPPLKELDRAKILAMVNAGLRAAAFEGIPLQVAQQLQQFPKPLDVRVMFAVIRALILE